MGTIARRLETPMTASEISDATDAPRSTTYRTLDLLFNASIVVTGAEIGEDGHHTAGYVVDFEAVSIGLTEDREFVVAIERPARTADERPESCGRR